MKGKINEIASKFATAVVVALIGWSACADVTVQKKRKDQIYNDDLIVVDVSEEGIEINTNAVRELVDASFNGGTNAVNAIQPRVAALETEVASHVTNYSNPHNVTMQQVGIAPSWLHPDYGVSYADKAGFANELRTSIGPSYTPEDIAAIETAAATAAARAETNSADIASHSIQLSQLSKSVADKLTNGRNEINTNNSVSIVNSRTDFNNYISFYIPPFLDESPYIEVFDHDWGVRGAKYYPNRIEHLYGTLSFPTKGGTMALTSDIPAPYVPSATNETFANAVLAVSFPTNVVADLGELNEFIHDYGGMGATTIGGLLAALAAAVVWMKRKIGEIEEYVCKASADIDAAIVARGGTTDGGLANAAAAITAIP